MIQHHCRLLRESLLVKEAHVDPTDIDRENNTEQQHHDYALVLPKTYFFWNWTKALLWHYIIAHNVK